MNHHDSTVGDTPALLRNGAATMPTTHTSRMSHAALLRASSDVGYAGIGRATGHDKSWVSRFLSGQGLASLPELLHWLDAAGLSIGHANDGAIQDAAADLLSAVRGEMDGLEGREVSQAEAQAAIRLLKVMLARDES